MSDNRTTSWGIYCKNVSLGCSINATYAKLCLSCGGAGPESATKRLEKMLVSGAVDEGGYRARMDAIEHVKDMIAKGIQTNSIHTPKNDWFAIDGGHQRRTHL